MRLKVSQADRDVWVAVYRFMCQEPRVSLRPRFLKQRSFSLRVFLSHVWPSSASFASFASVNLDGKLVFFRSHDTSGLLLVPTCLYRDFPSHVSCRHLDEFIFSSVVISLSRSAAQPAAPSSEFSLFQLRQTPLCPSHFSPTFWHNTQLNVAEYTQLKCGRL